jgi:hypothetical protein
MKKTVFLIACISAFLMTGCTEQNLARNWGGNMTINLEPNEKLEEITWKDDAELWYLTRPMRDDEEPEIHSFKQSSNYGIFEGTVTIIETR